MTKIRSLIPLLLIPILLCMASTSLADDNATHVVIVQPYILHADNGTSPAPMRIPQQIINQAYSAAGIEIHFLEPIPYHNTKLRDGQLSLEETIKSTNHDHKVRLPGQILNMYFVNAINGNKEPQSQAKTPNWQTFIILPEKEDPQHDALTIASHAAHTLGLPRATKDPKVPNDVPNLLGAGPIEKRLAKQALNQHQVNQLRTSPLVKPRIWFLSVEDARNLIADETYEPFCSQLQPREILAMTGEPAKGDTPQQQQADALMRFQDSALPFTDKEIETLKWYVNEVEQTLGDDYPMFREQPWRFIKLKDRLVGGFPHTRSTTIFFAQRILSAMIHAKEQDEQRALAQFGPLFAHEQMHVLERLYPKRFKTYFEKFYGLQKATVKPHQWVTENQISNPDAMDLNWVYPVESDEGKQYYWMRTILRIGAEKPRMGYDFQTIAIQVKPVNDKPHDFEVIVDEDNIPVHLPAQQLAPYVKRLPVNRGIDHPNEILAYYFGQQMSIDYLLNNPNPQQTARIEALKERYKPFKKGLMKILGN